MALLSSCSSVATRALPRPATTIPRSCVVSPAPDSPRLDRPDGGPSAMACPLFAGSRERELERTGAAFELWLRARACVLAVGAPAIWRRLASLVPGALFDSLAWFFSASAVMPPSRDSSWAIVDPSLYLERVSIPLLSTSLLEGKRGSSFEAALEALVSAFLELASGGFEDAGGSALLDPFGGSGRAGTFEACLACLDFVLAAGKASASVASAWDVRPA